MRIKTIDYRLVFCGILGMFVLLQNSVRADTLPGLVAQEGQKYLDASYNSQNCQQDVQIPKAECLRLLDEVEINEELRQKAIDLLMSSNIRFSERVRVLCDAFVDRPKSFVRQINQLFEITESKETMASVSGVDEKNIYGPKSYKNLLGQTVFNHFPVYRSWLDNVGSASNIAWNNVGDYIDVNGDGMLDYVVAYIDNRAGNIFTGEGETYYRATFINNGNGEWTMISCESSTNLFRFARCS